MERDLRPNLYEDRYREQSSASTQMTFELVQHSDTHFHESKPHEDGSLNANLASHTTEQNSPYPPHQYKRLSGAHFIRLFCLASFDPEVKQFHGKFIERDLANATDPEYTALSYTWGAAVEGEDDVEEHWTVVIHNPTCDDGNARGLCITSIAIQPNLAAYLKAFSTARLRDGVALASLHWIDAICINQKHDEEKLMQISLMGNIYRDAIEVHAWLGESDRNWQAFQWVHEHLLLALDEFCADDSVNRWDVMRRYDPTKETFWDEHMSSLRPPRWSWIDCWESYWRFFYDRRWFRRAWTYQEAVLACHLNVFCGPNFQHINFRSIAIMFHYLNMSKWSAWLTNMYSCQLTGPSPILMAYAVHVDRQKISKYISRAAIGKLTTAIIPEDEWILFWQEVCTSLRERDCYLMEDKIHASIGIASMTCPPSVPRELFQETKGLNTEEIYRWMSSTFLRRSANLDHLSQVGESSRSIPGWTADYSRSFDALLLTRPRHFNAYSAHYTGHVKVVDETLVSTGVKISTILSTGGNEDLAFAEWCLHYMCRLPAVYPWVKGQSSIEAVWRSLIWNANEDLILAEHSYGHGFKELLENELVLKFLFPGYRFSTEDWEGKINMRLRQIELVNQEARCSAAPSIEVVRRKVTEIQADPKWPSVNITRQPDQPWVDVFSKAANLVEAFRGVLNKVIVSHFSKTMAGRLTNRTMLITESAHIGMAHDHCAEGDEIWILAGGRVPYVLRPCDKSQSELDISAPKRYIFKGDCYIHGIMEGEYFQGKERDEVDFETVYIL